jgi:hypothetical protein
VEIRIFEWEVKGKIRMGVMRREYLEDIFEVDFEVIQNEIKIQNIKHITTIWTSEKIPTKRELTEKEMARIKNKLVSFLEEFFFYPLR